MPDFMAWLDDREQELRRKAEDLYTDQRQDEGDLVKIRVNVCGVCRSLVNTLGAEKGLAAAEGLRSTWQNGLAQAKDHGDTKRILVETIKLEMMEEALANLKGA